jgi:DNA invertase Pin-like site-specific DNA recombinase
MVDPHSACQLNLHDSGSAQFERRIMLARQREGVAEAKGKYRGRKPTVRSQVAEIVRLKVDEKLSDAEIARRLGVHSANVGRVLK